MGRSRSPRRSRPAPFGQRFAAFAAACDGEGLHALLRESESEEGISGGSSGSDDVAAEVVRAARAGTSEEGIDALSTGMQQWIERYSSLPRSDSGAWMLPTLLWLARRLGRAAAKVDARQRTQKHQRNLVEVFRKHFQRLHHDKRRRDGGLAICCELLRLYYRLGQASQCSPMLKKLSHGQGGESLDFAALPAALAVTLCFLWGKHLVLEGDVLEAEKKLTWALEHCPPKAAANRRRILGYLVPCRLRMGQSPGPRLLRKHGLEYMEGIVRAVMQGDVRLFDSEFAKLESKLVGVGTILVVEKLKLVAYWNLCRRVHAVAAAKLKAEGKKEEQQDLGLYEHAFKWQDGCDASETLSLLANLMFLGAVRGSIYYERRKIVFSKVTPFPKVSEWCSKV